VPKFDAIKNHPSLERKGLFFERCCKWFLENDPRYSMQLKKVWLWKDWPDNWGIDKGIDLIAETHNGSIWAIQAKNYHENYYITKDDVDKFISESSRKKISFRLLIATTNRIGPNAKEVIVAQEKPIGLCLLDSLESSSLDWSLIIKNNRKKDKNCPKTPWLHQTSAILSVMEGFKKSFQGQLHMACGTGKTLVGLYVAKKLNSHNTLVLVPSISLVAQLYREWSENSGDFTFDPIFICSDKTINKKDQDGIDYTDLGFPVTTSADELIKQYLSSSRPKVVFSTYHSSPVIAEAIRINNSLSFDLVIADEAHRCAGKANSAFATITDKDAIKTRYKLFMTATPVVFSDRVKKITKDYDYGIVSMDDVDKFGPIFHSLLFSQAIKDELLSDYQVIISVIDSDLYKEYIENGRFINIDNHEIDARTLASQLIVAKTIKQNDLNRIITFHNRKEHAEMFINSLPKALSLLSENERPVIDFIDKIIGDMSQADRSEILEKFKETRPGSCSLLANVKCLSEGVDIPILDGIAFIEPKGSEVDIIQAVGRVIRKAKDKKIGTIIIPVFVDNITDEETTLEQSCFNIVWKIIKALRSHDDVLAEELDTLRLELGKKSYKKFPKLNKIKFDVPVGVSRKFCDAIKTKIIEYCAKSYLNQSHPDLAAQFHPTKNGDLTVHVLTTNSNKKIWWKCSIGDDHEWEAPVTNRIRQKGCPICINRIVVLSNCLAITHPNIAAQWHPTKNGDLTLFKVTAGSSRRAWWKCSVGYDHEWEAVTKDRKRFGCGVCAGKTVVLSNCLATTHSDIAAQWHPTKNGDLTPSKVTVGSNKKIWWKCPKGEDHEWEVPVCERKKYGCGVCAGMVVVLSNCLATTDYDISAQWHPSKNGKLTAFDVTAGSNKKVWWKCPVGDDHEWVALVSNRKKQRGCPICLNKKVVFSNSLTTTHPTIAAQWHTTKNNSTGPNSVHAGSHKKVWWVCLKNIGHDEWLTEVRCRTRKNATNCPECYKN
jgi:superfamily II DNA or RNA helicase